MKVSSGNRFYAEVIRQRLKERKANAAPTLARDLPKHDAKERTMQEASSSTHTDKCSRRIAPLVPLSPSKKSKRTLPVEEAEALGVPSGFARVPSSNMFTRTQSAEMNAAFYELTLTRPYEAQLIA
jgi:hypothetical protein